MSRAPRYKYSIPFSACDRYCVDSNRKQSGSKEAFETRERNRDCDSESEGNIINCRESNTSRASWRGILPLCEFRTMISESRRCEFPVPTYNVMESSTAADLTAFRLAFKCSLMTAV